MSRTEEFLILDSQNTATTTGAKNPQCFVRRKLADISNLPQNRRTLIQDIKSISFETTTKEYIGQMQKLDCACDSGKHDFGEDVGTEELLLFSSTLLCNSKIIEQSRTELDRLRLNLLKMHEQNQQIALSNSLMFAEVNSVKGRLKVLQHEVECKSGLFNARKVELEGKARTVPCKNENNKSSLEEREPAKEVTGDEKPQKTERNSQSNTSDSSEQLISKETYENKRTSVRRQSAGLKAAELKPAEDSFETDVDINVRACLLPNNLAKEKRPSRLSAKKVQSYKEIPINVKMRRPV